MKAVIISIKPKWVELIMSGKKLIEIRKNYPSQMRERSPFRALIYECGTGNIVGECDVVKLHSISMASKKMVSDYAEFGCVEPTEMYSYAGDRCFLCGWELKNVRLYEEPKPLSQFGLNRPPQSWCYVEI